MNRIDRLFGILTLLQSRKYVTAERIGESFGISIRTVYRDVKALAEQGIPVSFEPGKGYFIVKGYFLPPVSFTSNEAAALLLIENIVNAFSDKSILKHYSEALQKIKAVMSSEQKEKLEVLFNATRSQYPTRFKNNRTYLSLIQNAIVARQVLELEYKNNKDESSKRLVEPIGLIFYAFAWHLIAWCQLRNNYRDFKIERIVKLSNTQLSFKKQSHISVNEFMKQLPVDY